MQHEILGVRAEHRLRSCGGACATLVDGCGRGKQTKVEVRSDEEDVGSAENRECAAYKGSVRRAADNAKRLFDPPHIPCGVNATGYMCGLDSSDSTFGPSSFHWRNGMEM